MVCHTGSSSVSICEAIWPVAGGLIVLAAKLTGGALFAVVDWPILPLSVGLCIRFGGLFAAEGALDIELG